MRRRKRAALELAFVHRLARIPCDRTHRLSAQTLEVPPGDASLSRRLTVRSGAFEVYAEDDALERRRFSVRPAKGRVHDAFDGGHGIRFAGFAAHRLYER